VCGADLQFPSPQNSASASATENFDTYRNLQPHRAVLPAIAWHLVMYICMHLGICCLLVRMNKLNALPRGFGAFPALEVLDLTYNNLSENSLPGNFFCLGMFSSCKILIIVYCECM